MGTAVIGEVDALLRSSIDAFRPEALAALSGAETIELLRIAERLRNQLAAADAWLLSDLGEKAMTGEIGTTAPADLLVTECRTTLGEARSRVRAARDLGPRRGLTGEVLEPIFAATADALADGLISAAQAAVIRSTLPRIPADRGPEASATAEAYLIEAAQHIDVRALRVDAEKLLARLGVDREPAEARSERNRHVTMYDSPLSGFDGTFHLTDIVGAKLQVVLDALAKPQPTTDADGTVIEPDQRTAGQRRHDAFDALLDRVLRSGDLPDCGGVPVTIQVRIPLADLTAGLTPTTPPDPADLVSCASNSLNMS